MERTPKQLIHVQFFSTAHRAYHLQDMGLKTKDYTLICRLGEPPLLFDRHNDPFNRQNIADAHPKIAEELTQILQGGWRLVQP